VLAQHRVDQGLVIPAASVVDLLAEPVDHRVVEAQGDGGLAGRRGQDRPAGAAVEVGGEVLVTAQDWYWLSSLACALSTETMRMVSGSRQE
jgi:hypothetical protein